MKIKKLAKIFDQVESMWYIGKEWQVFRLNLTHQQFIDELADQWVSMFNIKASFILVSDEPFTVLIKTAKFNIMMVFNNNYLMKMTIKNDNTKIERIYELFKKFETEFLADHEKIKTELDLELFVGKLGEQILGDVYSLEPVYKTGGNHIEVTAVGYGYSVQVEYHITKHKLLKLAVINTLIGDRRITYAVEYD